MEINDGLQVVNTEFSGLIVASASSVCVQGVINIEAEYWTDVEHPFRAFVRKTFGTRIKQILGLPQPRLKRYAEAYQITTDTRTGNILARKSKIRLRESLPCYTCLCEGTIKKCTVWSDSNITCSPLSDAGKVLLTAENGTWHIGLGIISALIREDKHASFEAVNFRSIKGGWYGPGIKEGWAVRKAAIKKRNALRNEPKDGKIVWRVKTDIDDRLYIKWDASGHEDTTAGMAQEAFNGP